MKTIVLAGGGTAGHITPHLAILPELKKHFDKIYYVGSGKSIEKTLMNDSGVQIFDINPPAFIRSLSLKNLLIPYKLYKAVKECENFLKKVHANVIFSKGGYCALPVCIAGFNLKIPVLCHESDLTLGLANKLCAKKCKALLTTFKETAQKHNGVYVGPIIRKEFFCINKNEARKKLNVQTKKPVLLIMGGSQGSKNINDALNKNLNAVLPDFTVIHLYGKNNKPIYSAINGYYPFAFTNTADAINACDICISRGGSNTLFELLCTQTPSLIVPLKKGSRGDQIKNAEYFLKKGAILYQDEEILRESLPKTINELYLKRPLLKENIKKLDLSNGTQKTVNLLIKYSK